MRPPGPASYFLEFSPIGHCSSRRQRPRHRLTNCALSNIIMKQQPPAKLMLLVLALILQIYAQITTGQPTWSDESFGSSPNMSLRPAGRIKLRASDTILLKTLTSETKKESNVDNSNNDNDNNTATDNNTDKLIKRLVSDHYLDVMKYSRDMVIAKKAERISNWFLNLTSSSEAGNSTNS